MLLTVAVATLTIQLLIDSGLSQAEAEVFADEFEDTLASGFTESFEGSIAFNENGTYESTDLKDLIREHGS